MGSTPPWAGVTPAPSGKDKRRCGTSSLLELIAQKGLSSHPSFLFQSFPFSHPERSRTISAKRCSFLCVILERSEESRLPEACVEKDRAARNPSCRDLNASRYKENRFALREYSGQAPVFYSSSFRSAMTEGRGQDDGRG